MLLEGFLKECHDGVGGFEADFVRGVGVGGLLVRVGVRGFRDESPGGASGERGGKGEESNDQLGGKVWRFEAVEGNGGIGVDSSEEELGLEDVDGLEDRILLGDYGRIVG